MRRLLLVLAAVSLAWVGEPRAQVRFEAPTLTQFAGGAPTTDLRAGLSVGDLDHDGILDVVTPSGLGALALLGHGDGTLSLPVTAGRNAPFSVIADFDGDGHADIGWVNGVSYGDGSGQNWEIVEFSAGWRGGVVAADFDGDGRTDLAAHKYSDEIATFLSRPNRTWHSVVAVTGMPWANGTKAMRVADVNRDGRPDIVLLLQGSSDIDFAALIGRGDGTFEYRPHPPSTPTATGLGVMDFTGDDIPDVVLTNRFMVTLFQGLGDGTFGPWQTVAFDTLDEQDLAVGDVTGDGLPDLVTTDLHRARLLTRAGRGDGTFGPRITSLPDVELLGLELADMNGDRQLDVVSLNEGRTGVAVALGDGNGRFGTQPPRLPMTQYAMAAALGDVNNDGRPDVVATSEGSLSSLEVSLNAGDRNFTGPLVTSGLASQPFRVHLADLDRDSRLDALVYSTLSVQSALGNGDGTFRLGTILSFGGYPTLDDICLADVNGDSIPDLIGGNDAGLLVWPGLGDGAFGMAVGSPLPHAPAQIATGDLDGDGIVDIGLAMEGIDYGGTGTSVARALGTGTGTFALAPGAWIPPGGGSTVVAVGDVNGDGRDDLLGVKLGAWSCPGPLFCGRIACSLQDPSGGMGAWLEAPWQDGWRLRIADVNGDAVRDLVSSTELGIGVALSDAGGHFTIEPGYGPADMSDVCLGDLDADGRTDAVVALTMDEGLGVKIYFGRDPSPSPVAVPGRPIPHDLRSTRILDAFPNPWRSGLRVRFRAAGPGPVTLGLYDPAGRMARTLYRGAFETGSSGREMVMAVEDRGLPPGLYFLRLTSPAGFDTRRVALIR